MALQQLVRRANDYVQLVAPPNYAGGVDGYGAEMPQDYLVDAVFRDGNQAYTAMVGNPDFQRGRRWGLNMYGSS